MPSDDSREDIIDRSALRDTSELKLLRQLVSEHESAIINLKGELEAATETVSELQIACATNERLTSEVAVLKAAVEAEKLKAKRFWRLCCEQMLQEEDRLQAKDAEILQLREQLNIAKVSASFTSEEDVVVTPTWTNLTRNIQVSDGRSRATVPLNPPVRQGKAPPVESFNGEDTSVHWNDWLPTLEQAATWNNWSEQEKLIQLAGHLHGKAQ